MSVVLDSVVDLSELGTAAFELQRLNERLAAERTIPQDVAAAVRELTAGLDQTNLNRWESIDSYHALLVLHSAVGAQRALEEPDSPQARDQLRVALETIRQGFTAIAEREPVGGDRDSKQIVQWLAEQTEVPQSSLAELLDVSPRQLQRWLSETESARPNGEDARKVRLVARIVNQLRFVLTPAGTINWFGWPRRDLNDRTPADLLADPAQEPSLYVAAVRMRSQLAS